MDTQSIDLCHIVEIKMERDYFDGSIPDVLMPGGITLDNSWEEMIIAYGEPTEQDEYGDMLFAYYEFDSYDSLFTPTVKFIADVETGILQEIEIDNPQTPEVELTEFDGIIPDFVTKYQAPAALGKEWSDFTVRAGSKVYALPAPLEQFIEDGWTPKNYDAQTLDQLIPSKASVGFFGITLIKDGKEIDVLVKNYADKGMPLRYCFVTRVSVNLGFFGDAANIDLPGGLSATSTLKDIEAAYGKPDKINEFSHVTSHEYGDYNAMIKFEFSKDSGNLYSISYHHEPREL